MKVWFYGNSVKLRQSPTHVLVFPLPHQLSVTEAFHLSADPTHQADWLVVLRRPQSLVLPSLTLSKHNSLWYAYDVFLVFPPPHQLSVTEAFHLSTDTTQADWLKALSGKQTRVLCRQLSVKRNLWSSADISCLKAAYSGVMCFLRGSQQLFLSGVPVPTHYHTEGMTSCL